MCKKTYKISFLEFSIDLMKGYNNITARISRTAEIMSMIWKVFVFESTLLFSSEAYKSEDVLSPI